MLHQVVLHAVTELAHVSHHHVGVRLGALTRALQAQWGGGRLDTVWVAERAPGSDVTCDTAVKVAIWMILESLLHNKLLHFVFHCIRSWHVYCVSISISRDNSLTRYGFKLDIVDIPNINGNCSPFQHAILSEIAVL